MLRQYAEEDVPGAWARVVDRLAPGGALVEGTCDELGRLAAWARHAPLASYGALTVDWSAVAPTGSSGSVSSPVAQ